jgi:hypothetical protein
MKVLNCEQNIGMCEPGYLCQSAMYLVGQTGFGSLQGLVFI